VKRKSSRNSGFALSSLIGYIFQEASNLDRPDNERKVLEMLGNVFLEWYEMT